MIIRQFKNAVLVFIMCLQTACYTTNLEKVIIFSEINTINQIKQLYQQDIFLRSIIDSLSNYNYSIEIQIDNSRLYNNFIPNDRGGVISFKNDKQFGNFNAVIEEFFHAYQNFYYLEILKFTDLPPLSNLEYEAKLFRNLIALQQNRPIAETPSQKGLLDVVYHIIDNPEIIKKGKLDSVSKKLYFRYLNNFQKHWKDRDINEGLHCGYSDSVDLNILPLACMSLITNLQTLNCK